MPQPQSLTEFTPAQQTPGEPICIAHKNMRVLLVTPLLEPALAEGGQSIPEAMRLLVKELIVLKAYEGFSDAFARFHPDLVLFIGGNEIVSPADLKRIRQTNIPSAVWMNDERGVTGHMRHMAQAFDYVFTQHQSHLDAYREAGCTNVRYLPFPADPEIFSPQKSMDAERFDVLIIGDAAPQKEAFIDVVRGFSPELRLFAVGKGWGAHFVPALPSLNGEGMRDLYNRSGLIIQWEPVQRRVFEAASCGVFQLVEASEDLFKYMRNGVDVVSFADAAELSSLLNGYAGQADRKRMIASQALWSTHYDYSSLHIVMELLQFVASAA